MENNKSFIKGVIGVVALIAIMAAVLVADLQQKAKHVLFKQEFDTSTKVMVSFDSAGRPQPHVLECKEGKVTFTVYDSTYTRGDTNNGAVVLTSPLFKEDVELVPVLLTNGNTGLACAAKDGQLIVFYRVWADEKEQRTQENLDLYFQSDSTAYLFTNNLGCPKE